MRIGQITPAEFLDANVIIRYLLQDSPDLGARAKALIDSSRVFLVSTVTLAEVSHVLRSVYRRDHNRIASALIDFLGKSNVDTFEIDTVLAIDALESTRNSGRINVADALVQSTAKSVLNGRVWTFDERFLSDGIEVATP